MSFCGVRRGGRNEESLEVLNEVIPSYLKRFFADASIGASECSE